MKVGLRLFICLAGAAFIIVATSWRFLSDIGDQYGTLAYLKASLSFFSDDEHPQSTAGEKAGDKIIVMAKMEAEHTNWVEEELSDWQRAIYIVDSSRQRPDILTTPLNKGHEAMAYLTYVIENYDTLPSIIAFLHAHRDGFFEAWHVDSPMHDNVAAMRALQLDYVQANGYVNLRCKWNPGCLRQHRHNQHITRGVWQEVFKETSTPPVSNQTEESLQSDASLSSEDIEKQLVMPMEVGAACCAQFAVSRDQVLKRPLEDYIKFRRWVIETEQDDAHSGRVMEFLWHVIFGKEAVYCPTEEVCYCNVYGRC